MILKPQSRARKTLDDFFVFDTETGDTLKNGDVKWKLNARPESFIFGCVVGVNYRRVITSVREFQQEFHHPRYKGKTVFAHNAEYDLNVIFDNIYRFDNRAIFNGRFISATNGNCTFADSMNILKMSVAKIGEQLGFPKLELGTRLKSKKSDREKDITYCFRDCDIIFQGLLKTFEDAGVQRLTQASLSMALFRNSYLDAPISHDGLQENFYDSYYGGRVEMFKEGKCQASVIDRNSMYPYEMSVLKFPDPERMGYVVKPALKSFRNILKHYEGCCYCTVVHPNNGWQIHGLGLLPIKVDGKLLFPIGKFTGCWNFNELRFAIEHGVEVIEVTKMVYAVGVESPFKRFVKDLYNKRLETDDEFESTRIKIFMNSLYGKFAQRPKEEFVYMENWRKDIKTIEKYQNNGLFIELQLFNAERSDAFLVLKSTRSLDGLPYSIPSFASYITSGARISLATELLRYENQEPLYCDTDSIFIGQPSDLPNEKHLGGWKKENKIVTRINGLKNYEFETIEKNKVKKDWKIKGVQKNAKKTGPKTYVYKSMIKTKEGLRRNMDSGIFVEKTKQLKGTYSKRILLKSGRTKPIIL